MARSAGGGPLRLPFGQPPPPRGEERVTPHPRPRPFRQSLAATGPRP
jgi:hypothetical protein